MGHGSRNELCPVQYVGLPLDDHLVNKKSKDFQSYFDAFSIIFPGQLYIIVFSIIHPGQLYVNNGRFPVNSISMTFQHIGNITR